MTNPADPPYDRFQIMRGVACLMVFANHIAGLLSAPLGAEGRWYGPLLVPLGFPWVWLFLILSGFLLTKQFASGRIALDREGVLKFYRRRSRRLFPMLIFTPVLLGVLFSLGIWSPNLPAFHAVSELQIALALPWVAYVSGNPVASVNSAVWSAVLEVHYFILLPLLLAFARLRLKPVLAVLGLWAIGIAMLAASVAVTGEPAIFPGIYQQHFYNAGFMLAGCALALVATERARPVKLLWPVAATAAAMVGTQYLCAYDLNLALALLPLLLLGPLSWLVFCSNANWQAPLPHNIGSLALSRGPLRWLELAGMMSYSIYLLHKPLGYIAVSRLGLAAWVQGIPTLLVTLLLTLIVILPVIIAAFVFVEVRFRHPTARPSDMEVRWSGG